MPLGLQETSLRQGELAAIAHRYESLGHRWDMYPNIMDEVMVVRSKGVGKRNVEQMIVIDDER